MSSSNRDTLCFTIQNHSLPYQVNDIPEIAKPFMIRFQQIWPCNCIFFIQSMCLKVTIELLQCWVLKVPEIKVFDGEIVDEQFCHLGEFSRNLLGFTNCLFSCKADQVFCEGKDDHVEARWRLEMIFFVIVLFLRQQGCKSELLVVSGYQFDNSSQFLFCQLIDESIEEGRTALNVLFIRVKEITASEVVVRLYQSFWFKTDQSHTWWLDILDFIHVLLSYLYFLTSQRVISANYTIKENLTSRVQFFSDPLQQLVSLGIHLLGRRPFGLSEQRIYLDPHFNIFLLTLTSQLFPYLHYSPIQSPLFEFLLPQPFSQIHDFA